MCIWCKKGINLFQNVRNGCENYLLSCGLTKKALPVWEGSLSCYFCFLLL